MEHALLLWLHLLGVVVWVGVSVGVAVAVLVGVAVKVGVRVAVPVAVAVLVLVDVGVPVAAATMVTHALDRFCGSEPTRRKKSLALSLVSTPLPHGPPALRS